MIEPAAVLGYWFGGVERDATGLDKAFRRWFSGGEAVDREIVTQFGEAVELALAGGFAEWEGGVESRLALVLLLDQFPRNIFRQAARAFAGDERALRLARASVADGSADALPPLRQVFLLMPYQHAEDIEVQREGLAQFRRLARAEASDAVGNMLESTMKFADKHLAIIERFGRFPHRNDVLGRLSTPAESAWLQDTGERFGQ